jgi:hypothetical protein
MAGKLALKRLRRAQVREQQQAAPTQDRLVIRMLGAAGAGLHGLLDRALLVVPTQPCAAVASVGAGARGFLERCRCFGIVASLAQQDGPGRCRDVAAIPADAMHHLRAWLKAAGNAAGGTPDSTRSRVRLCRP